MQYIPAFPVSVWKGHLENNNELKDIFLPFVEKTKNKLTIPNQWATDKLITSFNDDDINAQLFGEERKKIQDTYWKKINNMFDKSWTADINEAWYNYYTEGEWQELHAHNSHRTLCGDFVGVHFISWKNDTHLPLSFHDPNRLLRNSFFDSNYSGIFTPNIKEGDVIFFPSYLEHSVPKQPSTPDYPRITISFNIKINSYNGEEI